MSNSKTAQASRRFMLGVLAALPTLPAMFGSRRGQAQTDSTGVVE